VASVDLSSRLARVHMWLPRPISWGCGLTPRGGGFEGHVHAGHDEICLVANQGTTIRHGGVERAAEPGTVFLFRRGELHGYRNARDQEPHLWLVHFEADEELYRECPRLAASDPECRVWHVDDRQLAGYQALFIRLMAESIHPDRPGCQAALSSWLRLILISASRWSDDVVRDPPAITADPDIANLWEIIHEHIESPVADLTAALARRVPKYDSLRHRFKRIYGRAPRDLMMFMRIERAKQLLLETSLPVGVIAAQIGYGRLAEFTRAFTSQVGRSPRAFRLQPA
jgi:AraC-like DNA-binding protein